MVLSIERVTILAVHTFSYVVPTLFLDHCIQTCIYLHFTYKLITSTYILVPRHDIGFPLRYQEKRRSQFGSI